MNNALSTEEYVTALEKMKNSPQDILGILGNCGVTGLGTAAGIAASNTIAGAFGATTLYGSTTLAGLLGGFCVTATPVGWVVGSAIAVGMLAFGTGKMIKNGSRSDTIKKMTINKLSHRIQHRQSQTVNASVREDNMRQLIDALMMLVKTNRLSQNKSTEYLMAVQKGEMPCEYALSAIKQY